MQVVVVQIDAFEGMPIGIGAIFMFHDFISDDLHPTSRTTVRITSNNKAIQHQTKHRRFDVLFFSAMLLFFFLEYL